MHATVNIWIISPECAVGYWMPAWNTVAVARMTFNIALSKDTIFLDERLFAIKEMVDTFHTVL